MKKISFVAMICAISVFAYDSFAASKLISSGALTGSAARAGALRIKPVELKVADKKTLVVQELPNNADSTRMVVMSGGNSGFIKNMKTSSSLKTQTVADSNSQMENEKLPQNYKIKAKDFDYVDVDNLNKTLTNGSEYLRASGDHIDVDVDRLSKKLADVLKKLYVGEIELSHDAENILWRYKVNGNEVWNKLIAISDITGAKVEMDYQNGAIVWKYNDDKDWQNLLSLSDLPCRNCQYNGSAYQKAGDVITDELVLDDDQWNSLSKYVGDNKTKFLVEYEPVIGDGGVQIQANEIIVDRGELIELQQQIKKLQEDYNRLSQDYENLLNNNKEKE